MSEPGHTASELVALAVTDGMPVSSSAGKLTSDPPPAIALIAPARKPAGASTNQSVIALALPRLMSRRMTIEPCLSDSDYGASCIA